MSVIDFCSDLIRCKSVTPEDDGAIGYIAEFLKKNKFEVRVLEFTEGSRTVKNLFAKYSSGRGKKLGFLGHSDVVPAGENWASDPFDPICKDGFLIGRGVADMKGGIAAFCYAVSRFLCEKSFCGTIKFFITGDEEIGSYQGIRSVLDWAEENGEIPDDCLLGEPSSEKEIGDRVYIGHRGSLNVTATAVGRQGHVAYPQNYDNSLARICQYISLLKDYKWIYEDRRFPLTNLEPTLLFTQNHAENVVPEKTSANINIRFGSDYSSDDLKKILSEKAETFNIDLDFHMSGEAYCCNDTRLKGLLAAAIKKITGSETKFSAAGGTSDGRHMIKYCNVIEFGLCDETIHQKNERVKIQDLKKLEEIYFEFLNLYFDEKNYSN